MDGGDQDESVMDMNKRLVAGASGAAVIAAIAIGGVAVASGSGSDSDEVSLSSAEGKDASTAALKETGGGKANSVEKDNENNSVWEVEVTKKDGSTVDVRLDKDFKVVAVEDDGDNEADDQEGPGAFDDDSDVGDDNSDKD